ncbi:dsDNA nuclease domain-containing protein [Alteromonas macleodii]|uniref:dsDNA nuclease domain-containing protein n=1 Tax=Alteromonas macleodii TaxID=28108 RepID=UPI0022AF1031|nr:SEC-C metal-binding domain-containing protein [Alteromonas macleodii]MCZ4239035.1 SEC-C metal-binding domain-containing protein [Alteromonas macleodii]
MLDKKSEHSFDVLDEAQLTRIEAVHRGFLYQHLYTVGCLLLAQEANIESTIVELDEDIELLSKKKRIYIQVKTRSKPIIPSDVSGAIERFDILRKEHTDGNRKGEALFVLIANQEPSPQLQKNINNKLFPGDIKFISPKASSSCDPALPPAWESLSEAAKWCTTQAQKLNFSLLSPDSLIWKLAGLVQLAATGDSQDMSHVFQTKNLPKLFEQLLIQLQDFPEPPENYVAQMCEPTLISNERIRIICGLSGSGKTAWAAQAALHSSQLCAYYDTGDIPAPALASTLVRELAAKFAGSDNDGFRKILLPGVSGYDALRTFDTYITQQGTNILLVIDNSHRIPAETIRNLFNSTKSIHFILLCQPNESVRELESLMGINRETLKGWDIDSIAAVVNMLGGYGTPQGFENLKNYTGGLPLYVQSAANLASTEYENNIDTLCADLTQQKCSTETAQEIILSRIYQGLDKVIQDSFAIFSLADVGLSTDEIVTLLSHSLNIPTNKAVIYLKKMRATGAVEAFGNKTLKVHDSLRALGLIHLNLLDEEVIQTSLITLKDLIISSLHKDRDTSRFALLIQVFIKLNDVMALISISGEELFYEMGINTDILASIESALNSDVLGAEHKFWALDGLVFSAFREGHFQDAPPRLEAMEHLIAQNEFSYREHVAFGMKKILLAAENGKAQEVERLKEEYSTKLPDAEHKRIFNYNYANALWKLKKYRKAKQICHQVVGEYYDILGITPKDVLGKNSDVLWTIINRPENVQEHIKHLADALELYARILDELDENTSFTRIHAMKFYNMTMAPDSMVRVGQDLADEFVARKDYEGAKEVIEQHILPVINQAGLINRMVQVRSQYAVILAYCGLHNDAASEIKNLNPYIQGLSREQRTEIENQTDLISHLAQIAQLEESKKSFGKVGRNEQCPCGSGLKYKKCHGVI